MKKPHRRVLKNYALRNELIEKGFIIPDMMVPEWLKQRGFELAASAALIRRRMV